MYYFTPASDMFETADSIVIYIELAGVKKEDINIEIGGGIIEIGGIKRCAVINEEYNFQRMERPFGLFKRRFNLPSSADWNTARASFEGGLLEIIMPKRTGNKGFRISCIEIDDQDKG